MKRLIWSNKYLVLWSWFLQGSVLNVIDWKQWNKVSNTRFERSFSDFQNMVFLDGNLLTEFVENKHLVIEKKRKHFS